MAPVEQVAMVVPPLPLYEYRWFLRRVLPQRHNQLCRVVNMTGEGKPPERGFIVVEFADGHRVVTTRVAIKRLRSARGAWVG